MSVTLSAELSARLRLALDKAGHPTTAAEVVPAADTRFGDYQSNVAMLLAKQLGRPPREIAGDIIAALEVDDLSLPPEIAGAGFVNFRISPACLAQKLAELQSDPDRLGLSPAENPRTIVIDFSSPNVAKPMHVGHIRSTILGDCLTRLARFAGHRVITDNHLGDWGTQFGKVIYGWKHFLDRDALTRDPISELVRLYREVHAIEEAEAAARKLAVENGEPEPPSPVTVSARLELVALQRGDEENHAIWRQTVDLSRREFEKIYARLGITFDHYLGESFYNDALAPLVDRLLETGVATKSQGAVCLFFEEVPALADKPCIIRKSDGGFLYATTDLATLEYRVASWHPDAIWYVTGAPQQLHFQQVFAAAQKIGIQADLQHVAFGSILGEDRRMMKTRSGDNVLLVGLLDEAISRAAEVVAAKNADLQPDEQRLVAETIGIGAVKYAELSQHRMTDYVFSWDKMLSFQGNTAPYLQNAYVRIRSIFRKLDTPFVPDGPIELTSPAERQLALKLIQFAEEIPVALEQFRPNALATYLFSLANLFHTFYEECPVLRSEGRTRESRLALCDLTAQVLRRGLELLGIGVLEKM